MVSLVRILGIDYQIMPEGHIIDGLNILRGRIIYSPATIEIDTKCSKDVQYETLMHEVVHAVDTHYDLGFEENTVEKMGQAMYCFMKNNPKLLLEIVDIAKKDLALRNEELSLGEKVCCVKDDKVGIQ
jgi:hypothetical protein